MTERTTLLMNELLANELAACLQSGAGKAWWSQELLEQFCEPLKELSNSELVALFEKTGIANPIAIEMARRLRGKPYDLGEPQRE